jgi:predicted NUDIX family phosphoesterase
MNRKTAETNSDFKQLIPYVIFLHGDRVFSYRRGKLMSEKRLLGNYSVGIGGHISVDDPGLFGTSYDEGLKREVNEEVKIGSPYTEKRIALINDDSNDVGSVHFGVVHLFTLEKPLVEAREKSINESGFITIEKMKSNLENYETWSQHCINALEKIFSQE